jgi:phage shock protein A
MALITRISRLFKADFHAVLDQVEEPRMLLKQAIREMEDGLSETELRQRHTLSERDELKQRQDELEKALSDIEEELDICFESNEADLARELIKRKLQTQRLAKRVSALLRAAEKELIGHQKILQENRATLESMRQKAELIPERLTKNDRGHPAIDDITWSPRELGVSDNDIEIAYLREKKRRVQS